MAILLEIRDFYLFFSADDTLYMGLPLHPAIDIVSGTFRPVMLCNFWICKRCQSQL